MPSLRETGELTQCLGPVKLEDRIALAFNRQLKFETAANHDLSISDVKSMFMTGGSVTKVSPLKLAENYEDVQYVYQRELTIDSIHPHAGFSPRNVDFCRISYNGRSRRCLQHHEGKVGSKDLGEDGRAC